jgi:membrane protein implicated in regulation of membrane protease activity
MLQRVLACAAATVMIGAIGVALFQVAVLILGFSSPVVVTVITLVAIVLLNSLRRRIRAMTRHRFGPGKPHSIHR